MWAASPIEEGAAELEGLRHALVHLVERGVRDLVVRDARHHASHQHLREFPRLHPLVARVLVDQEHRAPQAGDLQEEIPALRIGDVAHRAEPGNDAIEIERRRDHQQPVRPGEAFELDAERAANRAARAVGADQIAAGMLLASPFAFDRDLDAAIVLGHRRHGAAELQFEIRMAAHLLVEDARELGLLALQPIGMRRRIGNGGEVELRQKPVLLRAILKRRRLQPLRHQRLGGAERLQHVERRRMEGRGAGFLAELRALLEHGHRHASARQMRGGDEADRPRAGDENPFLAQALLVIRSGRCRPW